MKKIETAFRVALVPLDALAVIAGFSAAYGIRVSTRNFFGYPLYEGPIPAFAEFIHFVLWSALWLLVVCAAHGLYATTARRRFLHEMPVVFFAALTWILGIITWFFIIRELFFSRLVLLLGFVLSIVFIILGRGLTRFIRRLLLRRGIGIQRAVVLGDNTLARRLWKELARDKAFLFLGVIDVLDIPAGSHDTTTTLPYLGTLEETEALIEQHGATVVIVVSEQLSQKRLGEILSFCQERKIEFYFLPQVLTLHRSQVVTTSVGGMPLIELRQTPLEGWGKVIKKVFDIIFSLVGIALLLLPGLLIALVVRLDSPGRVLVKLRRVNQGKVFYIYKFRSMVEGAEQMKQQLIAQNERSGPLFKIKHDPRVTRVGWFLRVSRIDELPQFINVIKGEMSVVGPRPHEPEEVERYQKHHRRVLAIKPGMTGLAQVSGASDLDFEEEVRLDTYYIERWSLGLDLTIILKTIGIVLQGKGAA